MMKNILIVIFGIVIISCNNEESYNIGENYFDINTNIRYVDTFSISSYTVCLDSIRTSGYNKALIGTYNDDEFGTITAESYFLLGLPSSKTIPDDAELDSVKLMMIPDGYSVGDTMSSYGLELYELSEALSFTEELTSLYNTSTKNAKSELLGSVLIIPRPNFFDTVAIPVDYDFGFDIFKKILDEDDAISDNNNFIDYKKGFLLKGNDNNAAALRFEATDSSLFLRMYYHYFKYENQTATKDFPLYKESLQFNNIKAENSIFDTITSQRQILPSFNTDDKTYIHAGTPIVTRIEFQNIRKILEFYNNVNILSAELEIQPIRGSYSNNSLPNLVLYESDRLNQFGDEILDLEGNTLSGDLTIDNIYHEETKYTFNITSFIKEKIEEITEESPSMLITIPSSDINTSLEKCIIGSSDNEENTLKLKIYYMDYE